jgi:predicted transcriptional regulator
MIIEIPDAVAASLDALCKKENRPRVVVIREAINDFLSRKSQASGDDAFGLWEQQPWDCVDYQTKLREEWSER